MEHLLMALDVGALEEEPVLVRREGELVVLVLDDGRELVLDARELQQAMVDVVKAAA